MCDSEVEKGTIISGYIKNIQRKPLVSANVSCGDLDTLTLFNGFFKLKVEPGSYQIRAKLTGYIEQSIPIIIEEGEEKNIDFMLEEGVGKSRIFGHVIDKDTGEFIKNGYILLIKTTLNSNIQIDPKTGFYEINNLKEGTYDIWTSILDYEDTKQVISINDEEEKNIDIFIRKKEDEEVPWG